MYYSVMASRKGNSGLEMTKFEDFCQEVKKRLSSVHLKVSLLSILFLLWNCERSVMFWFREQLLCEIWSSLVFTINYFLHCVSKLFLRNFWSIERARHFHLPFCCAWKLFFVFADFNFYHIFKVKETIFKPYSSW